MPIFLLKFWKNIHPWMEATNGTISNKLLGEMWQAMSWEEQRPFHEEYGRLKTEYYERRLGEEGIFCTEIYISSTFYNSIHPNFIIVC